MDPRSHPELAGRAGKHEPVARGGIVSRPRVRPQQQQLDRAAGLAPRRQPGAEYARLVDRQHVTRLQQRGKLREAPVLE
jgi:hypothetical protein